jgi:hypothetical protein
VLEGADEYVVTPFGDHLVELIASTVLLGSVTLTHRRPQTEVRGGEVLVYRTPTRLAIGIWSGAAAEPVLILTEPTPEAAVAMMRRLVELPNAGDEVIAGTDEPAMVAPAPPPFDPTHVVGPGGCAATSAPGGPATGTLAGGVPVRVLARDGEWAEIVVESGQHSWIAATGLVSPGGPTASPTHRVGEGGAPGWERPDPTAPATVQLEAGAHVVVVEESGVWARIRTEDGWEGWVDGRLLRSV